MMKVNKKLIEAVKYNPTKKSFQMSVLQMCEKIDQNKLTLPLYQRDVSWSLQKSVDLLNYQLFGKAPVAPISINEIEDAGLSVPQVSFIDREIVPSDEILNAHQSVVDGQQRLTTNYKAYTNHDDFRNVVLDVANACFKITKSSIKKNQIPVGVLLNKNRNVLQEYLNKQKTFNDLYAICIDIRSKMMDYNYTINQASDLSEDEQIEWFEVLNNAGSKVTALQMSFSRLKIHNFDIYNDYINPFKECIQGYGFGGLFSPFTTNVSYPISSLNSAYEIVVNGGKHNLNYAPIPSDTKENQLTSLDVDCLNEIVKVSLSGLNRALEFIDSENLEGYVDRMDYILYLAGYCMFHEDNDIEMKKTSIIQWFTTVQFTNKSNGERRKIFDNLLNI